MKIHSWEIKFLFAVEKKKEGERGNYSFTALSQHSHRD